MCPSTLQYIIVKYIAAPSDILYPCQRGLGNKLLAQACTTQKTLTTVRPWTCRPTTYLTLKALGV